MADLKTLRKQICAEREKLTQEFQQLAAAKVVSSIYDTEEFLQSKTIAAYIAVNGEMNPAPLLAQAWSMGKRCYLPVLAANRTLKFALYNKDDKLVKSYFGIPEPNVDADTASDQLIKPEDLDLVILPLVGFDVDGNRLGMGGGYYDTTFAFTKASPPDHIPYLMGIAYEFQNLSHLDQQPWDVPLNMIVTEIQTRRF